MFFINPAQVMQFNGNTSIQNQALNSHGMNNLITLGALKVKKPMYKPHSKFTEEDDERLRELVDQYGDNSWIQVASEMPGRNSRQCRERWLNYLSPKLNTNSWTQEEDELLIEKHKELGTSWVRISKFFEGRTDQMCKNRFFLLQRKLEKKPYKRRNVNPQQASNIIGTPILIPLANVNGMIGINNRKNICASFSSSCSSSSSSPISSCTSSPIQVEIKSQNWSKNSNIVKNDKEIDIEAPIVNETTDLSFLDNLYHDPFDSFDNFTDITSNSTEFCDDFFMM